jgi:RNA polymerase sigma factor (sigma-70 family)
MTALLAQRSRVDRGFDRMYRRHVAGVYRYALAVLRDQSAAEDVTTTAFLNAYRLYADGHRPRNGQAWLVGIAHDLCGLRVLRSHWQPGDRERAESATDGDIPSATDVQRALGRLEFDERAALVMRDLEERSYAEIALILGLSDAAVETLFFRARRALREQLEGSLTCGQAERAISRDLDGRLSRPERAALLAHLCDCAECARLARSQRAQRKAIRALGEIPVPPSLAERFAPPPRADAGSARLQAR